MFHPQVCLSLLGGLLHFFGMYREKLNHVIHTCVFVCRCGQSCWLVVGFKFLYVDVVLNHDSIEEPYKL
jgi:hypothetical protein